MLIVIGIHNVFICKDRSTHIVNMGAHQLLRCGHIGCQSLFMYNETQYIQLEMSELNDVGVVWI